MPIPRLFVTLNRKISLHRTPVGPAKIQETPDKPDETRIPKTRGKSGRNDLLEAVKSPETAVVRSTRARGLIWDLGRRA